MNDALKMQISAFVDDELPQNESELLLRRLSQDAELREQVARYLAIGRLIRREPESASMSALRSRILAELGEEPAKGRLASADAGSRLVRPAIGFAIAASVALLAIIGLRQTNAPGNVTPDAPVVAGITEPAIDDDLLEMRRHHARSASDFGTNDTLSRFVTFELREGELVEFDPELPLEDAEQDEADSPQEPNPEQ